MSDRKLKNITGLEKRIGALNRKVEKLKEVRTETAEQNRQRAGRQCPQDVGKGETSKIKTVKVLSKDEEREDMIMK